MCVTQKKNATASLFNFHNIVMTINYLHREQKPVGENISSQVLESPHSVPVTTESRVMLF